MMWWFTKPFLIYFHNLSRVVSEAKAHIFQSSWWEAIRVCIPLSAMQRDYIMEINCIMANERNHFYHTVRESRNHQQTLRLYTTHNAENSKYKRPLLCWLTFFLTYQSIDRLTLQHFYPAATLHTDFELRFVQALHTKVPLSQVIWGIIKHPDVLLWCCAYSFPFASSIILPHCVQGAAHRLQNPCMSKRSLQRQHRNVWMRLH